MRRFFLSSPEIQQPLFDLSEEDARHALQVLRLQPGAEVEILDGKGTRVRGLIEAVSKKKVHIRSLAIHHEPCARIKIELFVSIIKPGPMDWLIQKATELGADLIQPLEFERTVIHISPADQEKKVERWNGIARESIKQCGGAWMPVIEQPRSVSKLLEHGDFQHPSKLDLVASLAASLPWPNLLLQDFIQNSPPADQAPRVRLWIGPEGDMTPREIERLKEKGAREITLGPRVLRAETAALAGLTLLLQGRSRLTLD